MSDGSVRIPTNMAGVTHEERSSRYNIHAVEVRWFDERIWAVGTDGRCCVVLPINKAEATKPSDSDRMMIPREALPGAGQRQRTVVRDGKYFECGGVVAKSDPNDEERKMPPVHEVLPDLNKGEWVQVCLNPNMLAALKDAVRIGDERAITFFVRTDEENKPIAAVGDEAIGALMPCLSGDSFARDRYVRLRDQYLADVAPVKAEPQTSAETTT